MFLPDEFQKPAIDNPGNTLVTAVLGSGKTNTLLARAENAERPLVLTFNREAARRAYGMTFHGFCRSLLGKVEVWNRQRSLYEMTQICKEMGIKDKRVSINEVKEISWRKCRGMKVLSTPWYEEYERRKGDACDFGDLLIRGLEFVRTHDVRGRYGEVLVDEFQDLNPLQFAILEHIQSDNIFAVGDPCQSIYTWRDAYPEIFDQFRQQYSPREFSLLNDYRHGPEIVACLEWIFPRGVIPKGEHGNVTMFECLSSNAERQVVVRLVKELGGNVDILCRYWAPLRDLAPLVDGDFVADPENEDYYPVGIEEDEGVRLRSIHGSKGLEFDNDIVVGCTQGVWPHQKMVDYDEEYRLLYVALGRAKRNLFITTGGSTSVLLCTKMGGEEFPCPSRHFAATNKTLEEVIHA